jgi:hypothetical protein
MGGTFQSIVREKNRLCNQEKGRRNINLVKGKLRRLHQQSTQPKNRLRGDTKGKGQRISRNSG